MSLISSSVRKNLCPLSKIQIQSKALAHDGLDVSPKAVQRHMIGKREIVGYGINGSLSYIDKLDWPMPAIRFKEPNAEIEIIREKELRDWRKLSLEEKKQLYRYSFCQTFSEINAPTGEWKVEIGVALTILAVSIVSFTIVKVFMMPPFPETITPEWEAATLQRMINERVNPITGVASKWDYEKGDWK